MKGKMREIALHLGRLQRGLGGLNAIWMLCLQLFIGVAPPFYLHSLPTQCFYSVAVFRWSSFPSARLPKFVRGTLSEL